MKKNEFLSGIVIGGILGLSLAILTYNSLSENKKSNTKKENDNYTELKNNIKDIIARDGDIENEDKVQEVEKQEDEKIAGSLNEEKNKSKDDKQKDDKKEKETGMEMPNTPFNNTSNEKKEKESMAEKEVRNPSLEVKMKAQKEGKTMGEDFADKLNFSKKISQLEEALKNLREENTK